MLKNIKISKKTENLIIYSSLEHALLKFIQYNYKCQREMKILMIFEILTRSSWWKTKFKGYYKLSVGGQDTSKKSLATNLFGDY